MEEFSLADYRVEDVVFNATLGRNFFENVP